jgi:hypothetical protein
MLKVTMNSLCYNNKHQKQSSSFTGLCRVSSHALSENTRKVHQVL